jgi:hypothetical protein
MRLANPFDSSTGFRLPDGQDAVRARDYGPVEIPDLPGLTLIAGKLD